MCVFGLCLWSALRYFTPFAARLITAGFERASYLSVVAVDAASDLILVGGTVEQVSPAIQAPPFTTVFTLIGAPTLTRSFNYSRHGFVAAYSAGSFVRSQTTLCV